MPASEGGTRESMVARLKKLIAWAVQTRVVRAVQRYSIARGGLLAGGIAYSGLFSISAALTIAISVFMALLGGNDAARQTVFDGIDTALPGLLATDGSDGIVSPDALVQDTAWNAPTIISILVLIWTATTVMAALKNSLRAMFGIVAPPENFLVSKARDLVGYVVLATGILLSAVLGTVAGTLAGEVLEWLGIDGSVGSLGIRLAGLAAALVVDWLVYVMVFRFVAGARPPRQDLFLGALVGAVGAGVMRFAGTSLVGAVDDPVLASFAALVTIILWLNLAARLALLVAAFTANPPAPEKPESPEAVHLYESPNYVTESDPRTQEWDYQPLTGAIVPASGEEDVDEPEPEPYRHGLIGWWQRRRIARLERRLERTKEAYAAGARRE
ncbi:MAG TPA: YihY/virulence factor BrkB family protein [Glycomyces sp.]|nr:YihY/virulence factor BrkB family protein [Glycomyces sp.]